MNKYFWIGLVVIILAGCKTAVQQPKTVASTVSSDAYKGQIESIEDNVFFNATGNEPFWSLNISEKDIKFTSLKTGFEVFSSPYSEPHWVMDANVKSYRIQSESGMMNITIGHKNCVDNMSGIASPYSVKVEVKIGKDTDFTEFKGCGKYITDHQLHDIWVLEKMNGIEVSVLDFQKELPNLEINTLENSFMGYAGCNIMSGTIFFEKGLLRFSNVITTRMACEPKNLEAEFLKLLQGAISYKVENLKLTLKNTSNMELVFKKVD